jgi:hypothetical protein
MSRVGAALDRTGIELREVAVATAGDDVTITTLGCHVAYDHGVWHPLTLGVVGGVAKRIEAGETHATWRDFAPTSPTTRGEWEMRLARVGAAVDRLDAPVRELSAIQVDGGMVINVSTGAQDDAALRSLEIADPSIPPILASV